MSKSKHVVIIGNEWSSIIKTRKERQDFKIQTNLLHQTSTHSSNNDSGDNEALENASGDIAEIMFIAEARNKETAALEFVHE